MKKIIATVALLISYNAVNAQIHYHNITPDTTVSTWNAFQVMPSTSAGTDLTIWWHPSPEVVVQTHGNCQVMCSTDSLPVKLEMGDSISATAIWKAGEYDALSSGGTGKWQTDAEDKYLAFRFKNGSSGWYYGWLKMSVGPAAMSFTVSEWAYNTQAGKSIKAGQAATTGVEYADNEPKSTIVFAERKVSFLNLEGGQYTFIIANLNGKELYRGNVTGRDVISMSDYPSGIYILQLLHDGYVHNVTVAHQ